MDDDAPVLVDVPDLVRRRARSHGPAGNRWLATLPTVVEELVDRWQLSLGGPLRGGTSSYVTTATDARGKPCVLKVAMVTSDADRGAFARSVLVHRLADGRGCARVLADDQQRCSMLLEPLGPNLHALGHPTSAVLRTVVDTLSVFWRPAPTGTGLPTGAQKAMWLAEAITSNWHQFDQPCDRRVIERAVDHCHERAAAHDDASALLLHGDAHGWNTLTTGDGHKLVDPEGLVGEAAVDLAVPMREYNEPLLAGDTARLVHRRAEYLAARAGVDPTGVWHWGFIERVSTGLEGIRHLGREVGLPYLTVAERCL